MNITVIAGGVGGARFLRGLRHHLREVLPDGTGGTTATVTAIVNTGDDMWLTGLRVCPDLDSIMYSLAGVNDEDRGWGRADESERASQELTAYGLGWPWFTLGDRDLGTHIARSQLLRDGLTITEATARLTSRWPLGIRLAPATDDEVETHVEVATESGTDVETMHFEEWWVHYRAAKPALRFIQDRVEASRPAPGVVEAILEADTVLIAPSNPVVSIGTVLGIPGIRDAIRSTHAPVVGVSPVIDGAAVRGMAEACLSAIGVAPTADAIASHYGSRGDGSREGILDGWLVDTTDAAVVSGLEADGIPTVAVPLWLNSEEQGAQVARDAIALAARLRAS